MLPVGGATLIEYPDPEYPDPECPDPTEAVELLICAGLMETRTSRSSGIPKSPAKPETGRWTGHFTTSSYSKGNVMAHLRRGLTTEFRRGRGGRDARRFVEICQNAAECGDAHSTLQLIRVEPVPGPGRSRGYRRQSM